ncbi:putative histidinol-phosphate transaminase, partial [Meira miltonrushii]
MHVGRSCPSLLSNNHQLILTNMASVAGVSAQDANKIKQLKPAHFRLEDIIRPNILSLKPYRCARDDYQDGILLDANENSLGHSLPAGSTIPHTANAATPITGSGSDDPLSLHRYPDPSLYGVKPTLAKLRNVESENNVVLGVGSDEILDLIQRVAAAPGKDSILICPPTYGMYSVCAAVNDLNVVSVPLVTEGGAFTLDTENVCQTLSSNPSIKIVFLCSPGNPTGTLLSLESIRKVLDCPGFKGLVVVDEAYIDFAEEEQRIGVRKADVPVSAVSLVNEYANVIVTQTLSKSFGLAAIRLGIAYSQPGLIQIMNNTKAPYNISVPTAHLASLALNPQGLDRMRTNVRTLLENRKTLEADLKQLPGVGPILGANEANFLLATILDKPAEEGGKPDNARAGMIYKRMAEERGLVVRNRSSELGCPGCLRITIGTEEENKRCIDLIRQLLE